MRRESTEAERKLWYHLRVGRPGNLKFRRQHPVPPYIVDFCCLDRKSIVELNGSQHSPDVDAPRTACLESQGFNVIRFWDNEALAQTDSVLEAIRNAALAPHLLPNPSPGGRGA